MGHYRFPAIVKAMTPRYVVVWDLQWALIECERLELGADLSEAMLTPRDPYKTALQSFSPFRQPRWAEQPAQAVT